MSLRELFHLILLAAACLPYLIKSQPPDTTHSLNILLQDYAYRAFPTRPRTGIPYNGNPPPTLPGINLSVLRLRSGSLRKYGVKRYNEFNIPIEVVEVPYVKRLALVYQNLGNWSSTYYPLQNHTYVSPVLGLLAYSAANISGTDLTELNLMATKYPILIHHRTTVTTSLTMKCVWFDENGRSNFTAAVKGSNGNTCSTFHQGHFALVVEGEIIPALPPPPTRKKKKKKKVEIWVIIGSVLGGLLLVIVLVMLVMCLRKYKERKKLNRMEKAGDAGETLRQTSVGTSTRAPYAVRTRTQPSMETDYVPF